MLQLLLILDWVWETRGSHEILKMLLGIEVGRTLRQIWCLVSSHWLLTLHQVILMVMCRICRHMLLLLNLNSFIIFTALIQLLILNLILILLLQQLVMLMRHLEVRGGNWGSGYWAEGVRGELLLWGEMVLVWYLENSWEAPCGGGLNIGMFSSRIPLGLKELYHLSCRSRFRGLWFDLDCLGLRCPELIWALAACFMAWSPLW